jgi:hypothetical protein
MFAFGLRRVHVPPKVHPELQRHGLAPGIKILARGICGANRACTLLVMIHLVAAARLSYNFEPTSMIVWACCNSHR